jgi:hypothetical protein
MMSQTKNYCPRHPKTETNLRCGKCGELICPDCLVQTPVGARCPTCARVRRLPTYDVSPTFLARGVAAGLVLAVALGVGFGFLGSLLFPIPLLPQLALVGIGYLIGEGISLSVNRKRGRTLKLVAAGAIVLAFAIMLILNPFMGRLIFSLYGLLASAAAFYVATMRL